MQDDKSQTDRELEILLQEMASVEQSLSTLQAKNKSLRVTFDAKQKSVNDQRRLIDQRKTQIDSVSQKVSED